MKKSRNCSLRVLASVFFVACLGCYPYQESRDFYLYSMSRELIADHHDEFLRGTGTGVPFYKKEDNYKAINFEALGGGVFNAISYKRMDSFGHFSGT